jgi:hypothetical protein
VPTVGVGGEMGHLLLSLRLPICTRLGILKQFEFAGNRRSYNGMNLCLQLVPFPQF